MTTELDTSDVGFDPRRVAMTWEWNGELSRERGRGRNREFADAEIRAADGVAEDRDVRFRDAGVLVEEDTVGVCAREIAERYAPAFIDLGWESDRVLALAPGQIFGGCHA